MRNLFWPVNNGAVAISEIFKLELEYYWYPSLLEWREGELVPAEEVIESIKRTLPKCCHPIIDEWGELYKKYRFQLPENKRGGDAREVEKKFNAAKTGKFKIARVCMYVKDITQELQYKVYRFSWRPIDYAEEELDKIIAYISDKGHE